MAALVRLETRYQVLQDRRYRDLWNARKRLDKVGTA